MLTALKLWITIGKEEYSQLELSSWFILLIFIIKYQLVQTQNQGVFIWNFKKINKIREIAKYLQNHIWLWVHIVQIIYIRNKVYTGYTISVKNIR